MEQTAQLTAQTRTRKLIDEFYSGSKLTWHELIEREIAAAEGDMRERCAHVVETADEQVKLLLDASRKDAHDIASRDGIIENYKGWRAKAERLQAELVTSQAQLKGAKAVNDGWEKSYRKLEAEVAEAQKERDDLEQTVWDAMGGMPTYEDGTPTEDPVEKWIQILFLDFQKCLDDYKNVWESRRRLVGLVRDLRRLLEDSIKMLNIHNSLAKQASNKIDELKAELAAERQSREQAEGERDAAQQSRKRLVGLVRWLRWDRDSESRWAKQYSDEADRYLSALSQIENLYPNIPFVSEIMDAFATPAPRDGTQERTE